MLPYIGGKYALAKWIIGNFPEQYREMTYVEAFGGGGWVLFKKDPSNVEVYNDLNSTITTLFRVIRDNYEPFCHVAEWSLHSRELFNEALRKIKDDSFDCDIERALAKAITQVQSFAGEGVSWGYQVQSPHKRISGKWAPFLRRLALINARLKNVQIENLDFEKVIEKYDRKTTLFYLDPPYIGTEYYYNHEWKLFRKNDHKRLAEIMKGIQGKFVMSYYEHPLAFDLYKGYNFSFRESVKHAAGTTKYTQNSRPVSKEMLIKNF